MLTIVIFASLVLLITSAHAATIQGTAYEWFNFEPLGNVIVEVNSTPVQSVIAKDGKYAFNLSKGSYTIKARYYRNNALVYLTEENITIADEGSYVLDLIMFPALVDEPLFEAPDIIIEPLPEATGNRTYAYIIIALALFALAAGAYLRGRKEAGELKKAAQEASAKIPTLALPEDLKQVMDILVKSEGRITQKELREKLLCSEAKVSLMLADLEDRGLVKKIKKGRGNIVLLKK